MRSFGRMLRLVPLQGSRFLAVLAVVLATAFGVAPAIKHVEAAPAAQLGPVENTSGKVVSVGGGLFQLERPVRGSATELEQVTIQLPPGVTVQTCDQVDVIGQYNVATKVFIASSVIVRGNLCPAASKSSSSDDDDNDDDDNDDDDNDDDDNDDDDNDDDDNDDDDNDDDDNDGNSDDDDNDDDDNDDDDNDDDDKDDDDND